MQSRLHHSRPSFTRLPSKESHHSSNTAILGSSPTIQEEISFSLYLSFFFFWFVVQNPDTLSPFIAIPIIFHPIQEERTTKTAVLGTFEERSPLEPH